MTATIHTQTRRRCPELADFLEAVCAQPLRFDAPHAIMQSSHNHTHLWALEWWAERHPWIDLDYRIAFVEEIFTRWRGRLKGLPPYRAAGYRVYLYEDLAPTVSVVANMAEGCPYGTELQFVPGIRDVMAHYVGRRWSSNFENIAWQTTPDRVLQVVARNNGSISRPTANALGVRVGELRILITQMGLADEVNAIRKRCKRRPAQFTERDRDDAAFAILELIWPAGYR